MIVNLIKRTVMTQSTMIPPVADPDGPNGDHAPSHTFYKPNKRGTGGAVRFELNRAKGALFVEAASQGEGRTFDWQNKITMKWGAADLGEAMAVLSRRQGEAKCFHKTQTANSAFQLLQREDPERAPYLFTLSRQVLATKDVRKVSIPLTHGEAAVLEALLKTAAVRLAGW